MTAIAGDWTTCEVAPHKPVSFTISKENFKNGAAGVSERSYQ